MIMSLLLSKIAFQGWFVRAGVQLPLPKHLNEEKVLTEISIEKDVDGFHPLNIGKLAMKGRDLLFLPCTNVLVLCCLQIF